MEKQELSVSHSRCRCPTCGEFFRSVAGFDKHREGSFSEGRTCRDEAGMLEIGMARNSAGYWVTALNENSFWGASDDGETQEENDLDDDDLIG